MGESTALFKTNFRHCSIAKAGASMKLVRGIVVGHVYDEIIIRTRWSGKMTHEPKVNTTHRNVAARRAEKRLAGGGARYERNPRNPHKTKSVPEGRENARRNRRFSRRLRGACALGAGFRGLRSLHSLHPRLISFRPSGPTARAGPRHGFPPRIAKPYRLP